MLQWSEVDLRILLVTGATTLAWTAADVLLQPAARQRLQETFREQLGYDPQGV